MRSNTKRKSCATSRIVHANLNVRKVRSNEEHDSVTRRSLARSSGNKGKLAQIKKYTKQSLNNSYDLTLNEPEARTRLTISH